MKGVLLGAMVALIYAFACDIALADTKKSGTRSSDVSSKLQLEMETKNNILGRSSSPKQPSKAAVTPTRTKR